MTDTGAVIINDKYRVPMTAQWRADGGVTLCALRS